MLPKENCGSFFGVPVEVAACCTCNLVDTWAAVRTGAKEVGVGFQWWYYVGGMWGCGQSSARRFSMGDSGGGRFVATITCVSYSAKHVGLMKSCAVGRNTRK